MPGFELTEQEPEDVLSFLKEALLDRSLVEDRRFADPFEE